MPKKPHFTISKMYQTCATVLPLCQTRKNMEFRLDCQDNVCKINGVSLTVLKANLVGFLLK